MADPTNENTPLDTDPAKFAAEEFRALKAYIKNTILPMISPFPVGAMLFYGAQAAPTGYLECDGAAVSRTTYASLFTKIGVSFGPGDGVTTFNVPDMRGKFPRGWDHGAGVDAGRVFGSSQDDGFRSHRHLNGISDDNNSGADNIFVYGGTDVDMPGDAQSTINVENQPENYQGYTSKAIEDDSDDFITEIAETRPKNVAGLWIIKT